MLPPLLSSRQFVLLWQSQGKQIKCEKYFLHVSHPNYKSSCAQEVGLRFHTAIACRVVNSRRQPDILHQRVGSSTGGEEHTHVTDYIFSDGPLHAGSLL